MTSAIASATSLIAPVSSSAPTITNSPTKKNSVGHSMPRSASSTLWRVSSSMIVAPVSATVAGSTPSAPWTKNARIVMTSTGSVRLSSAMSSIERRASSSITRSRASGAICRRLRKTRYSMPVTTTKASAAIGARLTMKSLNESPVAPAIRMFGGSPISVAVPPMFEAMISMSTSGIGSMSSASASRNVIGTISRTVVRLSRNADSSAVDSASDMTTASGRPRGAGRRGSRGTCRSPSAR